MYFRGRKPKGRNAGQHPYTQKDMKRVEWCINKGIHVAVMPDWKGSPDIWKVEIKINGKKHVDPKVYNGYDAQTKMYEYYKYYYDKSNETKN